MFQRITGIIVTVIGLILAIIIGFWALLFLALFGVVAMLMYLVRTRLHDPQRKAPKGKIIEGEFQVLDEKQMNKDQTENSTGKHSGNPHR